MEPIAIMPLNVYVESGTGLMIRSIDNIETEVNEALAVMYHAVTQIFGKDLDQDNAQHEICHTAGDIYHAFKESAIQEFGVTGNGSLWELVEQLTDKCLACYSECS